MTSVALQQWRTVRRGRIDDLMVAHARIGGNGPGRRWRTEQLNWALVLRVAAEFQGFARDLHDEAIEFFVVEVSPMNTMAQQAIRSVLTQGRQLDKGNAQNASLGADFSRLGMDFWDQMNAHTFRTAEQAAALKAMNKSRNAIAHADAPAIQALADEGWPLSQLRTIRRFDQKMTGLSLTMDTVVGDHLNRMFGGRPW